MKAKENREKLYRRKGKRERVHHFREGKRIRSSSTADEAQRVILTPLSLGAAIRNVNMQRELTVPKQNIVKR